MYFYPFILLISVSLLGVKAPFYLRKTGVLFALQLMAIILALDSSQVDYHSYSLIYDEVPTLVELYYGANYVGIYGEPGYLILQSVVKTLGFDYVGFRLVIYSLIGIVSYIIACSSNLPVISLIWYYTFFFHNDGNITRTALAASFSMLSLVYYNESKSNRFILSLVVAISFHVISFLVLLPIALNKLPGYRILYIAILLVSLVFGLLGGFQIIASLIESLYTGSSYVTNKIVRYASSNREGEGILRLSILFPSLILILYICFFKRFWETTESRLWFNVAFFCICIMIAFSDLGLVANRGFRLFGLAFVFLIFYQINAMRLETRSLYLVFILCIMILLSILKHYSLGFSANIF